ncbi:hypothetical protein GUJ93_ZPchr0007g5251 [Zizania palustris]|uniref:Uncharacterized protein n=1 Tax=Zizania palustris TaxID=103762 RepID=A0A8J5TH54_ZIZPA|nr:hypothetical protein GUJ93_ZPchr0007g5251 [Zizania palustris]
MGRSAKFSDICCYFQRHCLGISSIAALVEIFSWDLKGIFYSSAAQESGDPGSLADLVWEDAGLNAGAGHCGQWPAVDPWSSVAPAPVRGHDGNSRRVILTNQHHGLKEKNKDACAHTVLRAAQAATCLVAGCRCAEAAEPSQHPVCCRRGGRG